MGDVVRLGNITKLDINPDLILEEALKEGMTAVLVIGYDAEGEEYFASSVADGGTALWLAERFKTKLLAVPESELFA